MPDVLFRTWERTDCCSITRTRQVASERHEHSCGLRKERASSNLARLSAGKTTVTQAWVPLTHVYGAKKLAIRRQHSPSDSCTWLRSARSAWNAALGPCHASHGMLFRRAQLALEPVLGSRPRSRVKRPARRVAGQALGHREDPRAPDTAEPRLGSQPPDLVGNGSAARSPLKNAVAIL